MVLLEVGKRYLSRDGRCFGEVLGKIDNGSYDFKVKLRFKSDGGLYGYFHYPKDGRYTSNVELDLDLVEEIR